MDVAVKILDGLAALVIAALPAALLYWFLIHPFAALWRRLGLAVTYTVVSATCLAVVYWIWSAHEPLLACHYGYRPWNLALGTALLLAGAAWDWRVLRKLSFPVLAGLPELSDRHESRLLTDGPYARVRHPRYFGALLGIVGFAFLCNYFWLYAVVLASIPAGWLMIWFEERELRRRFGTEYEEYCRRVPKFIPRRSGQAGRG